MSTNLKLLHLNIEGSKHVEQIIPFVKSQQPDVVCLQELNDIDTPRFENELGMECTFAPMNSRPSGGLHGIGILSVLKPTRIQNSQYGGFEGEGMPLVDSADKKTMHDTKRFVLLSCDFKKDGENFRLLTTHFPVTPHGEASEYQRADMKRLIEILEGEGEFVLTGDFNAPRGGEIFSMLAEKYKDNIPPEITTSIDGNLHRAGQLPYMVDGIFSTPGYIVSNVVGHTGLSDHWGFTADISKL